MGPTIRAWINYLIENKWSGQTTNAKNRRGNGTNFRSRKVSDTEKPRTFLKNTTSTGRV